MSTKLKELPQRDNPSHAMKVKRAGCDAHHWYNHHCFWCKKKLHAERRAVNGVRFSN